MSPSPPFLFDPSGGLAYHLRALRFRRSLWRPFVLQVAAWLDEWRPPCGELVLVGPSGGYSLPEAFLARFAAVHVLEPDPLARAILRRRFGKVAYRFHALDCLGPQAGPEQLAATFPHAAILFCNVLGQVWDAGAFPARAAGLEAALARQHWASYHDLLSAAAAPGESIPNDPLRCSAKALAKALWAGQPIAVTDHGSGCLGGPQTRLALWQLSPAAWHVVAWCAQGPCREYLPAPGNSE
jgi:hypothetical protein